MLPRVSAIMAALFFLVIAVAEFVHDAVLRMPWPGFVTAVNFVAILLVPLWLAAAAELLLRRTDSFLVISGWAAAVAHAAVLMTGASSAPTGAAGWAGRVLLPVSVVVALLLYEAWPREERAAVSSDRPREQDRGGSRRAA